MTHFCDTCNLREITLPFMYNNKHLKTGHKRKSFKILFPKNLNVSGGKAEGNIEITGK